VNHVGLWHPFENGFVYRLKWGFPGFAFTLPDELIPTEILKIALYTFGFKFRVALQARRINLYAGLSLFSRQKPPLPI